MFIALMNHAAPLFCPFGRAVRENNLSCRRRRLFLLVMRRRRLIFVACAEFDMHKCARHTPKAAEKADQNKQRNVWSECNRKSAKQLAPPKRRVSPS